MPRRQTMGVWVDRFEQAAQMAGDDSVTPEMWKWWASMIYGELAAEVDLGALDRYFETSTTITATGAASYDEPEDHFSTVRLVRVVDSEEQPVRKLRRGEEAAYKGLTGDAIGYALVDDQLFLYPNPSSGTYKWYYVQQPTDLSNYADADIVDVVCPAGEAFFVWGVVAIALAQQKQDPRFALEQKEQARSRLPFEAGNRNGSEVSSRGPIVDDDGDATYGPDGWPIR